MEDHFNLVMLFLLLLLSPQPSNCQMIESVSVLENGEIGTVVYDLQVRLVRILEPSKLANVTVYAGQQEQFWPFAIKDLRIIIARPLDREEICEKQRVLLLNQHLGGPPPGSDCPMFHCCQLLHVNVETSPTSPTRVLFIRVAVQDLNDNAPVFPHIETPFATVSEDLAVGERILLPEATDADSRPFGVADYRISRWIQGSASHFQLNIIADQTQSLEDSHSPVYGYTKSGRPYLNLVQPLDREIEDAYEFVLEAVDGGQGDAGVAFTGSVVVLIRVRDVNDNAPAFDSASYSSVVQENTLPRRILQFKVFDLDAGENGRLFLSIDDPAHRANNLFRVSLQDSLPPPEVVKKFSQTPSSSGSNYFGSLHLLEHLDAEQLPPQLKFYITATDNGQPPLSSYTEVTIDIVNANDQAPNIIFLREGKRLTSSRLVLSEVTTAPESIVAEVHVTDADSSLSQLSCQITSERETFQLAEVNPFSGTSVVTGGRMISGFGHPDVPQVSSSTSFIFPNYRQFTIRTKVDLDRETRALYLVTLTCNDNDASSPLTRNASLHVSISDINDGTPVFEHPAYQGRVRENEASAPVMHLFPSPILRVTDPDVGRNAAITFSLREVSAGSTETSSSHDQTSGNATTASRSSDAGHFRIDPRTGRIWTLSALDAEEGVAETSGAKGEKKYVFYVIATDDGIPERRSGSALLTVIVEDVNDNPPSFEQYHYNFEVKENAPVGTMVGQVSVRDADRTAVNRKVRFGLRGRPEDLYLVDIDRKTGQLTMRRPIDYEKQISISLSVVAENEVPLSIGSAAGRPTSTSFYHAEASVIINVLNINDNHPKFVPISPYRKHIIFAWEQLPFSTGTSPTAPRTNQTTGFDQRRFCEPIPYKVIDKDCEPANQEFCCSLDLENTHDGLFGLLLEIPPVLCVFKRPPQPQSYKLMLRARDGTSNGSLSSQIPLSVIIKSEPDYNQFGQASLLGSRGGSAETSSVDAQSGSGSSRIRSRSGNPSQGGFDRARAQNQELRGDSRFEGGGPQSPWSTSSGSYSSQQMKIISALVSIAGIFCVLLLFIIAALKCGLLDGQHFSASKGTENAPTETEDECLSTNTKKHEAMALGHKGRTWNEYRNLNGSYPEGMFCANQKLPCFESGTKKRDCHDNSYEMSVPFGTTLSTNANTCYPARCVNSYQTIPVSPSKVQGKSIGKPLMVSTRILSKNTAFLAPDVRLIPVEGSAEFYGFSHPYQLLDATTLSKTAKGSTREASKSGSNEPSKMTFDLEMIPISQAEGLLQNDILGENKGEEDGCKTVSETPRESPQDLVVFSKSANYSSFV